MRFVPRHLEFQADAMRIAMHDGFLPPWSDLPQVEKDMWVARAKTMREVYNEKLLDGKRFIA